MKSLVQEINVCSWWVKKINHIGPIVWLEFSLEASYQNLIGFLINFFDHPNLRWLAIIHIYTLLAIHKFYCSLFPLFIMSNILLNTIELIMYIWVQFYSKNNVLITNISLVFEPQQFFFASISQFLCVYVLTSFLADLFWFCFHVEGNLVCVWGAH